MIKACFDTNIFISAFIFSGKPAATFDLAVEGKIKLVTSPAILAEVAKVLNNKFDWQKEDIKKQLKVIGDVSVIIEPKEKIKAIKYPPDNRILEAAVAGEVDYIISGDKKHLLALKKFKNIPIISAKQFLDLLAQSQD